MTAAWALEMTFYAALAVGATWASWRTDIVGVGLTMVLAAAVSNVAYFAWDLQTHLAVEVIAQLAIAHSARLALHGREDRPARVIVLLAALDAVFAGSFSYVLSTNPEVKLGHAFGVVSNGVFAVMCACVAYPGVRDAFLGRARDLAARRSLDAAHLNREWVDRQIDRIERGRRG